MRCFVPITALLAGCVQIADPTFDNPCDPAQGGICDDVAVAPPVPDAGPDALATLDAAERDAGFPVLPADAATPDAKHAQPDADPRGTGPCEPSGFTENVIDCPERIEGYCAYEFNIDPEFLSCDSFCEQIGRRCLRAWFAHSEYYCTPIQEDGCHIRVHEMICACSAR